MSIKNEVLKKLKTAFLPSAHAHEMLGDIPARIRLEADRVSQDISAYGARALQKIGMGTEFYEARPLQDDDDPSERNARLSVQYRQPTAVKRQAEVSQHVYMWICRKNRMDYVSDHSRKQAAPAQAFSKAQVAEILLLALAKHLAGNAESVGLLDMPGVFRGRNAPDRIFQQLEETRNIKDDVPAAEKRIPRNSTVILFSDFIMDPAVLDECLDRMAGRELSGHLVMVLDPAEITLDGYKGRMEFLDADGECPSVIVENVGAEKDSIQEIMREHIKSIRAIAEKNNFRLTVQRTDRPLHHALLDIYGILPDDIPPAGPESRREI